MNLIHVYNVCTIIPSAQKDQVDDGCLLLHSEHGNMLSIIRNNVAQSK